VIRSSACRRMARGCGGCATAGLLGDRPFPWQKQETGKGFLFFFQERGRPNPKPGQHEPFGAAIYCFCSCFSRNAKVRNPTNALRISKTAGNGGGDCGSPLPPSRLLRREDQGLLAS
jgi:hypothetical protein